MASVGGPKKTVPFTSCFLLMLNALHLLALKSYRPLEALYIMCHIHLFTHSYNALTLIH